MLGSNRHSYVLDTFKDTSDVPAQVPQSGLSGISEDYANESFIWGTNIRQSQVMRELDRFFHSFAETEGAEAKYLRLLREVGAAARAARPLSGRAMLAPLTRPCQCMHLLALAEPGP
jgi:hypothetical protein